MVHSMYVAGPFPLPAALFGALGADTLGHVVYGLNQETVRIFYCRYRQFLKAERAVTYLTMEMHVAVIVHIAVCVAEFISDPLATVINLVQEVVFLEKGQGAEYARLINCVNGVLKFGHSDGTGAVGQRLKYQKPVGCWFYSVFN
jgi:hypothetical protein